MRRRTTSIGAALAVGATATTGLFVGTAPVAAIDETAPSHAFTIEAEAAPLTFLPGRNETEVGARILGVRASVANPQIAYGLAATADLGLIEAQFGPQGPRAEVDSTAANVGNDSEVRVGPIHLQAHADARPSSIAEASTTGLDEGQARIAAATSSAWADAGDGVLRSYVQTELTDVRLPSLLIDTIRFRAAAELPLGGRPFGFGAIDVVGASFADVPVLIGPTGLEVDESRVPTDQVDEARQTVTDFFSSSPYAELRLAQPIITVADDGRSVQVHGGGLFAYFTSATPGDNYFLHIGLASGSLRLFQGQPLVTYPTADPPPDDAATPIVRHGAGDRLPPLTAGSPVRRRARPVESAAGPVAGGSAVLPPMRDVVLSRTEQRSTRTLSTATTAVAAPAAVATALGAVLIGALLPPLRPLRRRFGGVAELAADRYLRG